MVDFLKSMINGGLLAWAVSVVCVMLMIKQRFFLSMIIISTFVMIFSCIGLLILQN